MFDRCPFKYRLRYVDGLDTIPNTDADNALILGTALHTGIEEGVEQALDFYKNSFPVLTDDHIHEMMKLEAMIPKAKAMLPPGGTFELPIGNGDFIGFMDYLVPVDEDLSGKTEICDGCPKGDCDSAYTGSCPCGKFTTRSKDTFDLYDFKYSNNAKNYAVSGQLHEYKYWYELTHPGHRIRNMYFLIVPKAKIRQKSTETLSQFRDRLQAALKDAEPTLMPVQYNPKGAGSMERKLIDYLPYVIRDYAEFQGIMGSEQPEIEKAWNTTDDLLDNQFIPTAGNMGLSRWEKILGITPKGTDSLEDRRFRILTRINEELPYTLPQLRNILETLCGKGNYSADVEEGTYQLLVKIGLAAKNNFNDVESLLNRVVPQNMVVTLLQLYNTHAELGRFTHAQLAAYTHNQLRNEVLKNGE